MEIQDCLEWIYMIMKFCCKAMARAIMYETVIQNSTGMFVNGDVVTYCPFCGKEVAKISDEYIHEGY